MSTALTDIVKTYLEDTADRNGSIAMVEARAKTLPILQSIIQDFIQGNTQFSEFRERLGKVLQSDEVWFAQRTFMMELRKFSKNHLATSNRPAEYFRTILTGLNASNLGQRIEQCYTFFLKERERLRREGKQGNTIIAAGNSAYIISLFALWLDPEKDPVVCSEGIRKGLNAFVKAGFIPNIPGLRLTALAIDVSSAEDYQAYKQALESLLKQAPELQFSPYWAELFFYWIRDHEEILTGSASILKKEGDNSELLSNPVGTATTVKEPGGIYRTPNPLLISNEQLKPTSEPLLTQLIHEVQRHILIHESVIRRIYHALIAGHVILTGPPGTGKTELARIIPELLWQSCSSGTNALPSEESDTLIADLTTETAYTTRLVTATDDWSTRTLISGIAPLNKNGTLSYVIQYGHLTATINKNWDFQGETPNEWSSLTLRRTRIITTGNIERSKVQTFKGQWLVIDEFNRAPIDIALGDALTALGGNDVLRVAIEGGSAELPIPQDFRIIGTLNSFDRNYLNQISEALKRRFSFVEILPPTRSQRQTEQSIVLYKALLKVRHLSSSTIDQVENSLYWDGHITILNEATGHYTIDWGDEQHSFHQAFEAAWHIFEVIRIYRQLGTAQAISLLRHMLIAGILQSFSTQQEWIEQALDAALCDTIADQLQILLPDEIETLLLALTTNQSEFSIAYNQLLVRLSTTTPQRLAGQLFALSNVHNENGQPYLTDAQVEHIANSDQPEVATALLTELFHLQPEPYPLPQFTRRLRTFKVERGL